MKLQFNLLPDVKQEYLKTQKTKRTVITSSFIASSIAFFILLFMMTNVYVVNKKKLSDADKKISDYTNQITSIPKLNEILTVQHQLNSLSSLHQNKHVVSRIYDFLPDVTPTKVHLGKVDVDFALNTMTIQGTSDSQKTINTFIDTLKFTTYMVDNQDTGKKAFPTVIERQFGINDEGATYEISIQFDPALFAFSQKVSLKVPQGLSTTRSIINDPTNSLFDGKTGDDTEPTTGDLE
jgi:Tfp pilus assembly protein PilN